MVGPRVVGESEKVRSGRTWFDPLCRACTASYARSEGRRLACGLEKVSGRDSRRKYHGGTFVYLPSASMRALQVRRPLRTRQPLPCGVP